MPNMKKTVYITLSAIIMLMSTSCATIFGGQHYYARVEVKNHPNASIYYREQEIGKGKAMISIKRADANAVNFVIRETNCKEEVKQFYSKDIRWGAVVGSFLCFSWAGILVDFATESAYKPSVSEPGIYKIDYKMFNYTLNYTGCTEVTNAPKAINNPVAAFIDDTIDIIYFRDGSVVEGYIIEFTDNGMLSVKMKDNSIKMYRWTDIQTVRNEVSK